MKFARLIRRRLLQGSALCMVITTIFYLKAPQSDQQLTFIHRYKHGDNLPENISLVHTYKLLMDKLTAQFNKTMMLYLQRNSSNVTICKSIPESKIDFTVSNTRQFQKVSDMDVYVVSAFYDARDQTKPIVRIMALASQEYHGYANVHCMLRFQNGTTLEYKTISVPGALEVKPSYVPPFCYWNVALIKCANPYLDWKPVSVSITSKMCSMPSNLLKIHHMDLSTKPSMTLGLCTNTLYNFNVKDSAHLLEFFEFNKLLGVDKIFMYDTYNVSKAILKILRFYEESKYLEIINWKLPKPVLYKSSLPRDKTSWRGVPGLDRENNLPDCIEYHAQRLNYQDCLYRNMGRAQFLTFLDRDEFIIPRKKPTIPQLLKSVRWDIGTRYRTAVYTIQENFFCTRTQKDEVTGFNHTLWSIGRLSAQRDMQLAPKSIVKPERVVYMDVHKPMQIIPGTIAQWFHEKLCLVNHYRPNPYGDQGCFQNSSTEVDLTVERYSEQVKNQVRKMVDYLGLREL